MKPKPPNENAAPAIATNTPAADAPVIASADIAEPQAGGSYTRDPATGELSCATPATAPAPPMRKVQDPVTGAITKTVIQE